MKFDVRNFFENTSKKLKFHSILARIKDTLREDLYAITLKSHLFFLEREIFQTKVVEKIRTRILCSISVFPENRAVNEITWKNILQPDRPQ